MRKLLYIMAGLIMALVMVSCEKQDKQDLGIDALKAANASKVVVDIGDNIPTSLDQEVIPQVIPGENKGGNRTCIEVFDYFAPDAECGVDYLCGDKVDWDDDAEGFASSFPSGLNVSVDGIHIAFSIDGCLEINGEFYKVGAVIVKGSNAANVYFYDGGTTFDGGLAAPGDKHMVSNLTFCFVPCDLEEPEDEIFGVKVWYYTGDDCGEESYALSKGSIFPHENAGWCNGLGYSIYEDTDGVPVDLGGVGEITVVDGAITITMNDDKIFSASVFVGDESELDENSCPAYKVDWHYENNICENEFTFDASTFTDD
ncbi:MAG: hypothetical protein P1P86_05800 [Bacteroidales bacterium]|nr:hypothetical protein [Bacteroidales bacterium]